MGPGRVEKKQLGRVKGSVRLASVGTGFGHVIAFLFGRVQRLF
jgi:hypothetical protein